MTTTLDTERYRAQTARWPKAGRHILAQFDDESGQGRLLLGLQLVHPLQLVAGKQPSFDQPFGES